MKLADIPWEKPAIRPNYPHMLAMDAAVWTAYLEQNPAWPLRVAYDLHVGTPIPLPDDATEMQLKIAAGITRKRIDLIMQTPTGLYVVEIKPYGNHGALGQVLQYLQLFKAEYTDAQAAQGMIMCAEYDRDLIPIADIHSISLVETQVINY